MQRTRRIVFSAARRVAFVPARLAKRDFLAVFNYHQVSPTFDPKYHLPATWTSLSDFETQILKIKSRFRIVRLSDALGQLKDGTLRGACAAITLDDGDISLQHHITPTLTRHRIPATYFVNTGYWEGRRTYWVYLVPYLLNDVDAVEQIDGAKTWWGYHRVLRNTTDPALYQKLRDEVESHMRLVRPAERFFVTKEYLATLDPDLFSVGLHGHEHQRFSMMPDDWQRACIRKNIDLLCDLPGYTPIFAVPFGRPNDWDDRVLRLCSDMKLDVTFADGGINLPGNKYCQRMPADHADAMAVFRRGLVGW